MNLAYRRGTASLEEILWHLKRCDARFVPPLSSRVDLADYARRIHGTAVSFEAWEETTDSLVGMINAYLNDLVGQTVYITNVSVIQGYTRQGVASVLLTMCLDYAQASGFKTAKLEVSPENLAAMRLYARFGFETGTETDLGMLLMTRQVGQIVAEGS